MALPIKGLITKHSQSITDFIHKHHIITQAHLKFNHIVQKSNKDIVLFVTATAQSEANYYLIWHLAKVHHIDFKHIVIISTEFSQKNAHASNLKKLLLLPVFGFAESAISDLHIPNGSEETDIESIKAVIFDWLLIHTPHEVIFNITGGTKLMSIAQDQIAKTSNHYYCVYQSRAFNQLIWYQNTFRGKQTEKLILPKDISTRLLSRGYKVKVGQSIKDSLSGIDYISELNECLKYNFKETTDFISFINYKCSQLPKSKYPATISITSEEYRRHKKYFTIMTRTNPPDITFVSSRHEIIISNKSALEFLHGKWFEVLIAYYVFSHFMVRDQQVDVRIGLTFNKDSDGNEIDVAYLQEDGFMNFLECKTSNWADKPKQTTVINQMLHKLASISTTAGLNSNRYFVSLFKLTPQSMRVAKDLNIKVIAGEQILTFDKYIG